MDKYGASASLLNGLAVSKMQQGLFEEAETHLQEALTKVAVTVLHIPFAVHPIELNNNNMLCYDVLCCVVFMSGGVGPRESGQPHLRGTTPAAPARSPHPLPQVRVKHDHGIVM